MVLQKFHVYSLNRIYSMTYVTELSIKMAVFLKFNWAYDASKNNKPTTSCIDLQQSLKQIDMIPFICQSYIQYLFLAYK